MSFGECIVDFISSLCFSSYIVCGNGKIRKHKYELCQFLMMRKINYSLFYTIMMADFDSTPYSVTNLPSSSPDPCTVA